jgi:hypothetical protein
MPEIPISFDGQRPPPGGFPLNFLTKPLSGRNGETGAMPQTDRASDNCGTFERDKLKLVGVDVMVQEQGVGDGTALPMRKIRSRVLVRACFGIGRVIPALWVFAMLF